MQIYGLFTDGLANRLPTNPVTIRSKGSTVSPPTVRHLAPISVKNTMPTICVESISQIGLWRQTVFFVKHANRQNQFSNSFKIFSRKICQVARLKFKINFIKF